MNTPAAEHIPVLLDEVIGALMPRDGAIYVDGTFGAGGYSAALLTASRCRVLGIDRDPEALRRGAALAARHGGRLTLIEGRFGDMDRLVADATPEPIAGIALDLGVSSIQLDTAERGFSFRLDGPLDMRMGADGTTAADLVAELPEAKLAALIRDLGEERYARRIARAIAAQRQRQPIRRTGELAEIVRGAVPTREPGLDPATRTFQALRIAVNDELGEIDRGLAAAERLLMPGGRIAVVSFHSLEDTRVKNFLRRRSSGAPQTSRHLPATAARPPSFTLVWRRAVRPSIDEIARNPRARSARLRAAERMEAPPWPASEATH
ncbi:MAG TPA: 16S rRNA (cytosine(1402)-N(4))-methyltransferase RsmH [Stellaceae bacterium]|jgi:16S rRNA (cytosine1402-N4)-methyltransferase|nr:16S rRNA (cytosine(1402)-N(4))-methyltransferase RsmH [Stellaceae bacterium]